MASKTTRTASVLEVKDITLSAQSKQEKELYAALLRVPTDISDEGREALGKVVQMFAECCETLSSSFYADFSVAYHDHPNYQPVPLEQNDWDSS
jgi:hypothetical protein